MKKVVLFFAVATVVALASCGNKQSAPEVESTPEGIEEVMIVDSIASDSIQEEASIVIEEVQE